MQLIGTLAVITGGASGMGYACAKHFKQLGARLVLLDHNEAALNQAAKTLDALAIATDVSDAKQIETAFDTITRELTIPRICINCAGIAPAQRMVGRDGPMPLDHFAKVINVNLVGTFNVMRVAANYMSQLEPLGDSQERGVIINTASVAAYEGQIGQVAYSASKGGVVAMTLPAARELARFGIRVMTIAPGLVATPMLLAMPQEVQDSLAQQVPFPQRLAQPEEYARLAQHIIENEMLNGSVIRLDGAIRMQPK